MSATTHDPSGRPPLMPDPAAGKYLESGTPEGKGRLDVADQVVEKIAGHAVTLVSDAAAAPRRLLGVNIGGPRPEDAATVSAKVHDGIASVQATIAVSWPHSVQAVANQVRQRIREEVTSLTGVKVDHVDVDVVSFVLKSPEPRVR